MAGGDDPLPMGQPRIRPPEPRQRFKHYADYYDDAFRAGAAECFGVPLDQVSYNQRSSFKAAFFKAFHVKAPVILEGIMDMCAETALKEV